MSGEIKRFVEYNDGTNLLRIGSDGDFVDFEVADKSVFLPIEKLHELIGEVARFAPAKPQPVLRGGAANV
ncbi:hypothetical protein SEA_APHELION_91 [Gordonia phage Aphelion]|uniref:Uncharacterized protein n=2 Tax=Smoothievirus TaxID=1982557 RepID=A0A410TD58_9CAUD|nr:hypothetical protein BH768_gp115 [Gordonia phage ClubL]ANA86590.1 hypothetical protein PBI_CLUBL_92 [Gordonia phage ClubL]AUE23599.1 hypothetical protein SEA_TONIANN_92 [Gordonia phage Toniann]QAU06956.1 hypothetical protein SEA_APHELION_91 [Gordonia phage Aphelion]QYC53576.1 hypothetical protein SEA_NORVS_92 [Gordonia phage Norvs]